LNLGVAEILTRVNHMLATDLESNRFVTLLLVRLDPVGRSLTYASAGHVSGFLLNGDGEVEFLLTSTGPPMGLFLRSEFTSGTTLLRPRQLIFLGTDGVLDVSTGEGRQFGAERVIEYLCVHRLDPARSIAEGIYEHARAFGGDEPQDDDITSVVVKLEDLDQSV
jgi:serine phosphatase RsbU (regulator of sigma subunit)